MRLCDRSRHPAGSEKEGCGSRLCPVSNEAEVRAAIRNTQSEALHDARAAVGVRPSDARPAPLEPAPPSVGQSWYFGDEEATANVGQTTPHQTAKPP
jgi:hypothetical protein